ncbi:MAG: hypothetical protein RID96_23570 [Nitratireductor sp.]
MRIGIGRDGAGRLQDFQRACAIDARQLIAGDLGSKRALAQRFRSLRLVSVNNEENGSSSDRNGNVG